MIFYTKRNQLVVESTFRSKSRDIFFVSRCTIVVPVHADAPQNHTKLNFKSPVLSELLNHMHISYSYNIFKRCALFFSYTFCRRFAVSFKCIQHSSRINRQFDVISNDIIIAIVIKSCLSQMPRCTSLYTSVRTGV